MNKQTIIIKNDIKLIYIIMNYKFYYYYYYYYLSNYILMYLQYYENVVYYIYQRF